MADARIQDLDPVNQVQDNDNFVLEQNKKAHRLTGSKLIRYLITACDKLGILGVHVGPNEPKENQNVWIKEVENYEVPDESFALFDSRYPKKSEVPSKTSQLENNSGFITADDVPVPFDDTQVSTEKGWTSSKIAQSVAPALTRTVSGEVIAVDDVSPLEHEVKCTVSGVPDLSKVTVSRYGGLLTPVNPFGDAFEKQPDGSFDALQPIFPWEVSYKVYFQGAVFSMDVDIKSDVGQNYRFRFAYSDGTYEIPQVKSDGTWQHIHVESQPSKTIIRIDPDYSKSGLMSFRDFKVYVKNGYGYGDYVEPEKFTPSPDGIVSGMTSLSPNMTVLTDTPGAMLDVKYNADTMTIIDKLTQRVADLESATAQI